MVLIYFLGYGSLVIKKGFYWILQFNLIHRTIQRFALLNLLDYIRVDLYMFHPNINILIFFLNPSNNTKINPSNNGMVDHNNNTKCRQWDPFLKLVLKLLCFRLGLLLIVKSKTQYDHD